MRILLYNIRYGTGTGGFFHLPWSGYAKKTGENLKNIARFISSQHPDIVGLVEVDAGSFRSGRKNQAEIIADSIGHYHVFESKYEASSFASLLPVMNKQANAILSSATIHNRKVHYLNKGIKRLVIELELENLVIFLVHLSLRFRTRHRQLSDLYSLVRSAGKPCIVAGDFNVFRGMQETRLFLAATGLANASPNGCASYPSWAPKRELDFIFHSPEISVQDFRAPEVAFSDHLPLICDFTL